MFAHQLRHSDRRFRGSPTMWRRLHLTLCVHWHGMYKCVVIFLLESNDQLYLHIALPCVLLAPQDSAQVLQAVLYTQW